MKKIIKYIKKYPFDFAIWVIIVLGLLIASYFVLVIFVLDDTGAKYGKRLENIESYPVNNQFIANKIENHDAVKSATINVKGKVINVEVITNKPLTKKIIDEISLFTTKAINKDYQEYYDIQLFIAEYNYEFKKQLPVIGYVKAGNNNYAWTYNKGALS